LSKLPPIREPLIPINLSASEIELLAMLVENHASQYCWNEDLTEVHNRLEAYAKLNRERTFRKLENGCLEL